MTLRVLMTADAVGGVWTYALDVARGLGAHGVRTILALSGPSPDPNQRRAAAAVPSLTLIDTGLPLDWLAETPDEVAAAGAAIAKLASDHRVDLIHLNTPALAAPSPSSLRGGGKGREGPTKVLLSREPEADEGEGAFEVPLVVASHSCVASWWEAAATGPLPADLRWRTDLHAAGLRAATRTIAPTAAFAATTHRLYGVRPTVVRNGRDPLAKREAPMHDAAITVGRLWDKGKNVRVLDRAAARLPVPLFAAGSTSGPNGDAIALEHAHPLGHLSDADLGERLAARPVFVSAALYEPFGLAVLEAAAAGCALVLSDIPTFRELWDGCATFVDPHDDRAFAAAINALIGDQNLRLARGEAARTRARRFTPQATAAETLAIYRTLLPTARAVAA
ncbi:MAG: Glycosyltransferase [uncultured Sphingomonadaceae bacterium]|uniref:Glycosyltransferase n=1 Tax=uncultured Sphingomonadaceae bacterium TaxID=169976 RepID=A0A6J4U392_9SPHN|nr:MAG: Glycosyltransferase [uncultured Sphingomonadaceae bacterium]